MQKNEYQIEVDHLALGLTRAPTFMGIHIRLFFANMVLCTLLCIDAHTFAGVPLFFILHVCFLKYSLKEVNFFQLWWRSIIKTPPVLNYWYWGKTNSYEPW